MQIGCGNTKLLGFVASGRGFGAKTVQMQQAFIQKIIGGEAYPGTLNILLDQPVLLRKAHKLDSKGKLFGVEATINGVPCLLYRFNYSPLHVLEVISTVHLRNELELLDGSEVEISILGDCIAKPSNWRCRLWRLFYADRLDAYYRDYMHQLFTSKGFKFLHKIACQSKREFR